MMPGTGPIAGIRVPEVDERGFVAIVNDHDDVPPMADAQFPVASPHSVSGSNSSELLPMGQVIGVISDRYDHGDDAGGLHYKQTTDGQSLIADRDRSPSPNGDFSNSGYGSSSVATRSATIATVASHSQSPGTRDDFTVDDVETNRESVPEVVSSGEVEVDTAGKVTTVQEPVGLSSHRKVLLAVGALVMITSIGLVSGIICATGNCGGNDENVSQNVSTLVRIQQRGVLRCGVYYTNTTLSGQIIEGGAPPFGFSVDLCRALAAAIFGTATDTLNLTTVTPADRFVMLNDDNVDVLASSTTFTMERNVHEPTTGKGYSFSTPYLYSGLTFGGVPPYGTCANDQLKTNTTNVDCSGIRVCVVDSTTFASRVPNVLQGVKPVVCPDMDSFYRNFRRGLCNVLAGDQFETAEETLRSTGYFGEYEVGDNFFSKEPLALVTRQDDSTWSDFVNWIVIGLLSAEEQKITQDRASVFVKTTLFGEQYKNMFTNVVAEVGNYGELYGRHLEAVVPRKAVNDINDGTSGLLYAMPFGSADSQGTAPVGTLRRIRDRGFLRCGISKKAIFGLFNATTEKYTGFDVDFCRALSAAIFNGVTSTIVYTDLIATDRFAALARDDVDVLSRYTTVTYDRDVYEDVAKAGFSFSQPNFYDGVSFGGKPPYGTCAETQDTSEPNCTGLKICVEEGTTSIAVVRQFFPIDGFIVAKQSGELVAQGLVTGECNAIAAGSIDVTESNIREVGQYTGPYEKGSGRFSKDPLALVTRQDDPQWTAFVYWIVSAIFYAEEEGITSAKASSITGMPVVNLFGSLYTRMLKDAIAAVGSFAEIYDRHVEAELPRSGQNLLNRNPLQAQHYPLPGLEL